MTEQTPSVVSSILFVPGNRPDRYIKARECGADAYCIDLEDAVPESEKETARAFALDHLASGDAGSHCFLRINGLATRQGLEDLLALAAVEQALPACIIVPMVASAFEIRQLAQLLRPGSAVKIIPMIETPEGLDELPAMLQEGGGVIAAIAFGFADYAALTGSDMGWDALLNARSNIIRAASKHGVPCIDGPCFDIPDLPALSEEAVRVASLGFSGKLAIHPSQVETINAAFAPSAEKIAWAHRVIEAFEQAGGGVVSLAGSMIDQPLIDQARRVIAGEK